MHKIQQNRISIFGKTLNRNGIYKLIWSLNFSFVLGYVLLSYFTVQNIVERKQIAIDIENVRASIGSLESDYFSKLATLDEDGARASGYNEPETVSFAKIQVMNSVSLVEDNGS